MAAVEFQVMNVKRCIFSTDVSLNWASELILRDRSSQDQVDDRHEYTDRGDRTTCEHNFSNQSEHR